MKVMTTGLKGHIVRDILKGRFKGHIIKGQFQGVWCYPPLREGGGVAQCFEGFEHKDL